jgi:quinol monooxygenase YgiN
MGGTSKKENSGKTSRAFVERSRFRRIVMNCLHMKFPGKTSAWLAPVLFLLALAPPLRANPPQPGEALQPLVIITHVDATPQFTAATMSLLWDYRVASLKDPGAMRVQVLQQVDRPNHFTIVEEWADENAYTQHVSAAHTRQFRVRLAPMLGAPYDEREHRVVNLGT